MTDKELMDLVRTVALSQDAVQYQTAWQTLKAHCTQPTDVQQLKAEIALLCVELEESICYRGRSVNEIIVSMRQLSAV